MCVCNSQTYEGPKQEGCQPETQSAAGEKEECTAVGRSPQARGQYDWQLSAFTSEFIFHFFKAF